MTKPWLNPHKAPLMSVAPCYCCSATHTKHSDDFSDSDSPKVYYVCSVKIYELDWGIQEVPFIRIDVLWIVEYDKPWCWMWCDETRAADLFLMFVYLPIMQSLNLFISIFLNTKKILSQLFYLLSQTCCSVVSVVCLPVYYTEIHTEPYQSVLS